VAKEIFKKNAHILQGFNQCFLESFGHDNVIWRDTCLARIGTFTKKKPARTHVEVAVGINKYGTFAWSIDQKWMEEKGKERHTTELLSSNRKKFKCD